MLDKVVALDLDVLGNEPMFSACPPKHLFSSALRIVIDDLEKACPST